MSWPSPLLPYSPSSPKAAPDSDEAPQRGVGDEEEHKAEAVCRLARHRRSDDRPVPKNFSGRAQAHWKWAGRSGRESSGCRAPSAQLASLTAGEPLPEMPRDHSADLETQSTHEAPLRLPLLPQNFRGVVQQVRASTLQSLALRQPQPPPLHPSIASRMSGEDSDFQEVPISRGVPIDYHATRHGKGRRLFPERFPHHRCPSHLCTAISAVAESRVAAAPNSGAPILAPGSSTPAETRLLLFRPALQL